MSGIALPAAEPLTGEQALGQLLEGNRRYVASGPTHPHQTVERRAELEGGQAPRAVILCCADSRVPPEIVFDQGLGDLFVVRVAGNIIDNLELGSIEYAVEHLHAPLVVVLGHQSCGAVKATLEGGHASGHIHAVVKAIEPAVQAVKGQPGDTLDNAVRANVQRVAQRLREAEPILSEQIKAGKLKIVAARYDLHTGTVECLP